MAAADPKTRTAIARLGAYEQHARHSGDDTTKAGTAAFLARFEAQVDPDGLLSPAEREHRATMARKAHFQRLAIASVKARRLRSPRWKIRAKAETEKVATLGEGTTFVTEGRSSALASH